VISVYTVILFIANRMYGCNRIYFRRMFFA
jgi:hypothetical protein